MSKTTAIGAGLFLALMTLAGTAYAEELSVENKSKSDVHHLFISPANQKNWGPDQLGDAAIDAGGSFTVHKIPTGTYDLKLVDEDGTECVVEDVTIDEGKVWTITDKLLAGCADFK